MSTMTDHGPVEAPVRVGPEPRALDGLLTLPHAPAGLAVLLHGDAGVRHSPPPAGLPAALHAAGLATLELSLLTRDEIAEDTFTKHLRFDVRLQAARLAGALAWVRAQPWGAGLPAGCFATGAAGAAALIAAATGPADLRALALWCGRPDLAGRELARVAAPTLLVVEPDTDPLLELNRAAVPILAGARLTTLDRPDGLAPLASAWLARHLAPAPAERAVGA